MRKVILHRLSSGDEGTFGILTTDSGFSCSTGELPWHDNKPNESCIPIGVYHCVWGNSLMHGDCYHVEGVTNRDHIEIHAANYMGDKCKGMKCELLGCIAPGMSTGIMDSQKALVFSRIALQKLEADLKREDFELKII